MTAKPSLSRQISAVSIMIDIFGGAKTKPRAAAQLELLIADARAAHSSLIWLENNRNMVLDSIGTETIEKALTKG
jgi:hypothetical protein